MASGQYRLTPSEYQELRLSDMFSDPRLSRAFRRGEDGEPMMAPWPVRPIEPQLGEFLAQEVDA